MTTKQDSDITHSFIAGYPVKILAWLWGVSVRKIENAIRRASRHVP